MTFFALKERQSPDMAIPERLTMAQKLERKQWHRAIDTGRNYLGLAYDQRGSGFSRTAAKSTDIGAFEIQ